MAQKRKIEVPVSSFDRSKADVGLSLQNAANEVTKLYHQAVNFRKISFDAGRKHSLAKAYEWVSSQKQEGKGVTSTDVITYLQNEMNNSSLVPRLQSEAQEIESNQCCRTSWNAQIEANSGSSCSVAPIQRREPGGNMTCSQDQDLEIMQVDPG